MKAVLANCYLVVPDIDRDYLDSHSPLLRANEIKAPLLLIAGEEDEVVPFDQSKDLVKALKRSKANLSFLPIEKAGHQIFNSPKNL
jgi:dipeptidyl aminopeptidase/acylaminoacyl peptidase